MSHFGAWALAAAGSLIDMLGIREAILSILALLRLINRDIYHSKGGVGEDIVTNFGFAAIDNVMLLILGIATVGVVIWIEYYFRKGRAKGLLYKRIGKVLLVQAAIFVGVIIIRQIMAMLIQARV